MKPQRNNCRSPTTPRIRVIRQNIQTKSITIILILVFLVILLELVLFYYNHTSISNDDIAIRSDQTLHQPLPNETSRLLLQYKGHNYNETIATNQFIYATFLASIEYIPALEVFLHTLILTKPRYALAICIPMNTNETAIRNKLASILSKYPNQLNYYIYSFPIVPPPTGGTNKGSIAKERWNINWTKLQLWTLISYDKIFYIDLDVIFMRNIDDVFTYNMYSTTFSSTTTSSSSSNTKPSSTNQHPHTSSTTSSHTDLNTHLNTPTTTTSTTPLYFLGTLDWGRWTKPGTIKYNGGAFLLQPSIDIYIKLYTYRYNIRAYRSLEAEQGLFNKVFIKDGCCLPIYYNMQKSISLHIPYLWHPSAVYILHYTDEKPWLSWSRYTLYIIYIHLILYSIHPIYYIYYINIIYIIYTMHIIHHVIHIPVIILTIFSLTYISYL